MSPRRFLMVFYRQENICTTCMYIFIQDDWDWTTNHDIFHLRGFQIYLNGDCFCTAQSSSTCTQNTGLITMTRTDGGTLAQRDGSTAQRYDLLATDTRQQRPELSAFSNECDSPITWPWLHRDQHGIKFLELDETLNYSDENLGSIQSLWRVSWDKIPIKALDAESVTIDPREMRRAAFLEGSFPEELTLGNPFTTSVHVAGPTGTNPATHVWGSHRSCHNTPASSRWDLTGTPLSVVAAKYPAGTVDVVLGTGRAEVQVTGNCEPSTNDPTTKSSFKFWNWNANQYGNANEWVIPHGIVLQYTPWPQGRWDRDYFNGDDTSYNSAAGSVAGSHRPPIPFKFAPDSVDCCWVTPLEETPDCVSVLLSRVAERGDTRCVRTCVEI